MSGVNIKDSNKRLFQVSVPYNAPYLLSLLYLIFILMLPKGYFVDNFGVRPEDFIGFSLLFFVPIYVFFFKIPTWRSGNFIAFYFWYLLFITLINGLSGDFYAQVFVLFFKELSYVAFGFAMYLAAKNNTRLLLKSIQIILIPNALYGVYQIFNGSLGLYGISPFGHETSPASSGMLYFFGFIFYYIYIRLYGGGSFKLGFLAILFSLVVLSGSKLSVLGLFVFCFFEFIFNFKKMRIGVILLALVFILFISGLTLFLSYDPNWSALLRYQGFLTPLEVIENRGIWFRFEWINDWRHMLFGNGLSIGHVPESGEFTYRMRMDNLVLYLLVVVGVIGTTIFIAMILAMFKQINSYSKKVFLSVIYSFFFMGLGVEIFQTSISGSLFWGVFGLLSALNTSFDKDKEFL